ncbi:hypothetical protein ABE28_013225 [Peribacillus muralis]|uniref:Uncharacterized protein n=1 Tax=Peribacillus muralis TaxID=264697 RepID=A0A1B3XQ30_9BACI|nr:hypothetical protein ABE28_013225 [Peribacillus muralis]
MSVSSRSRHSPLPQWKFISTETRALVQAKGKYSRKKVCAFMKEKRKEGRQEDGTKTRSGRIIGKMACITKKSKGTRICT